MAMCGRAATVSGCVCGTVDLWLWPPQSSGCGGMAPDSGLHSWEQLGCCGLVDAVTGRICWRLVRGTVGAG